MHDIATLNWISILVAALSGFAIGSFWYGPVLFQKPWMALSGMSKEKGAQANMVVTFGGAYVLNALAATGIAIVLGEHHGWHSGLDVGAFAAVFFVSTRTRRHLPFRTAAAQALAHQCGLPGGQFRGNGKHSRRLAALEGDFTNTAGSAARRTRPILRNCRQTNRGMP